MNLLKFIYYVNVICPEVLNPIILAVAVVSTFAPIALVHVAVKGTLNITTPEPPVTVTGDSAVPARPPPPPPVFTFPLAPVSVPKAGLDVPPKPPPPEPPCCLVVVAGTEA